MEILVPVRYPLTEVNQRAIRRGRELAQTHENPELIVFQMNEVHEGRHLRRANLREAVEAEFGPIEATYIVRDGFLLEEAIIEEAIRLEVDFIVLSSHRRNRWRQILEDVLNLTSDPEQVLRNELAIEIEIVNDTSSLDEGTT